MKISENIELINDTLNKTYTNLQQLVYEEEIEKFIRVKLLDITSMSRDILEFIYNKETEQRKGKSKLRRLVK